MGNEGGWAAGGARRWESLAAPVRSPERSSVTIGGDAVSGCAVTFAWWGVWRGRVRRVVRVAEENPGPPRFLEKLDTRIPEPPGMPRALASQESTRRRRLS